MNFPNKEQIRHWWNIIHMETDEEKKEKRRKRKMQGHPAKNYAAKFKSTANKGSYRNSTKVQPRGGKSMK